MSAWPSLGRGGTRASASPFAISMEDMLVRLLPRQHFPLPLRYAASALIVLLAIGLRFVFGEPLGHYPLLLFVPAVFLCALLFDRGSGFFATILAAGADAAFVFGARDGRPVPWTEAVPIILFLAVGFTLAVITEALRQAIDKLQAAERSQSLLLQELGHRTKNDLAIISSGLQLQARASDDPAVREALRAAIARVFVISAARERLQGDADAGEVDLAEYLQALCGGLADLLRDVRPIDVRVQAPPLLLPTSTAVTVGLLVNELVTNAFKYAFPDERGGVVEVNVAQAGADGLEIVVRDHGAGCPADVEPGLGSRLVRLLAQQHDGDFWREPADPGCRVVVVLRSGLRGGKAEVRQSVR